MPFSNYFIVKEHFNKYITETLLVWRGRSINVKVLETRQVGYAYLLDKLERS